MTNTADLVVNLLAMSDWTDSDEQSGILREAATALQTSLLTDEEREAIEVRTPAISGEVRCIAWFCAGHQ